tara:strand:+ start:393 stop:608 length:216 start_codon:yes stop_codon:yes gene_type:complete
MGMIKYSMINGVQTITEICDTCKCHMKDLSIWDITIREDNTYRDKMFNNGKPQEKGRITEPRPKCYCKECK